MPRFGLLREIGLGVRTLMMHKLRSVLTMLGLVFGVSSVIAMLAVGEGAGQEALDQIRRLGSRNIIITSVKPIDEKAASTGARRSFVTGYGLSYADDARIRRSIPSVLRTVPAKEIVENARLGSNRMQLRVVGTSPDWFELVASPLIAGRVLVQADLLGRKNVCVLTEYGARKLLATANSLGESVRIGPHYFEVVGIVRTGIRPEEPGENDNGKEESRKSKKAIKKTEVGGIITPYTNADVYIPLTVFKEQVTDTIIQRTSGAFKGERVELHKIIIEVASMDEVPRTAASVETLLRRFHKKKDYRIEVPYSLLRQAEDTQKRSNIVLGSIAGISLLVGGIGIMNIMLASVTERTREIGIRRAIGARRRQIIRQFLIEATVLSTVGGLIGIGLGVVIPKLIERFFGMATIIPLYSIVLSLGISMAAGILFGLYPAVRAANLDPIEALRHE